MGAGIVSPARHRHVLHGRPGPGPGPTDVHCHPFSRPTLPPCGLGDTVGAGVDWGAGEVFSTHNGKDLGGAGPVWARRPNPDPREYLVPAVGLVGPGEAVTVNFGARPFVFDLAARVAAARAACRAEVTRAMAAGRGDPTDPGDPATTAALVRDFLAFSGCARSLSALDAARPPPPAGPPPPSATARLLATLPVRAAVRAFLAAGDVTSAARAAAFAPGVPSPAAVLANPPAALFLACQATVEKLRAGDAVGGIAVARAALAPFMSKRAQDWGNSWAGHLRARTAVASANGLAPFLGLVSPLPGSGAIECEAAASDSEEWDCCQPDAREMPSDSDDDDGHAWCDAMNDIMATIHAADKDAVAVSAAMARDVLALSAYDLSGPSPPGAGPPPRLAGLLSQAQRGAAADALNASIVAAVEDKDGFRRPGRASDNEPPFVRLAWPTSRLEGMLRNAAVAVAAVVETEPAREQPPPPRRGRRPARPVVLPTGPTAVLADFLPPRPPGEEVAGWEPIWGPPARLASAARPERLIPVQAEVARQQGAGGGMAAATRAKKRKAGEAE